MKNRKQIILETTSTILNELSSELLQRAARKSREREQQYAKRAIGLPSPVPPTDWKGDPSDNPVLYTLGDYDKHGTVIEPREIQAVLRDNPEARYDRDGVLAKYSPVRGGTDDLSWAAVTDPYMARKIKRANDRRSYLHADRFERRGFKPWSQANKDRFSRPRLWGRMYSPDTVMTTVDNLLTGVGPVGYRAYTEGQRASRFEAAAKEAKARELAMQKALRPGIASRIGSFVRRNSLLGYLMR